MSQQASILSSATVVVQRHQVVVQTSLETRAHASLDKKQSMGGRVSNVFIRWDIFQMQKDSETLTNVNK